MFNVEEKTEVSILLRIISAQRTTPAYTGEVEHNILENTKPEAGNFATLKLLDKQIYIFHPIHRYSAELKRILLANQ